MGPCARCARPACEACARPIPGGLLCPACAATPVPWEERRRLGTARAFALTLQPSLLAPERFFRRLDAPGRIAPALGYAFLAHLAGFSTLALLAAAAPMGGLVVGLGDRITGAIQMLAILAVLLVGFDLLLALLVHAVLRLLDAGKAGVGATVRAVCYGQGPAVLWATIVLPSLFVPQVWSALCTIHAVKQAQRTRPGVAATAVLVPTLASVMGLLVLAQRYAPALLAAAKLRG